MTLFVILVSKRKSKKYLVGGEFFQWVDFSWKGGGTLPLNGEGYIFSRDLRDKIMVNKLIYIPNDTQNYLLFELQVDETFGNSI